MRNARTDSEIPHCSFSFNIINKIKCTYYGGNIKLLETNVIERILSQFNCGKSKYFLIAANLKLFKASVM